MSDDVRPGAADQIRFESSTEPTDLIGAAELGDGGMIALDLLDPGGVCALYSGRTWTEEMTAVGRAVVAGAVDDGWWRLAVVAGVDRWAQLTLDEDLLRADMALAQWEAGAVARARTGFEQSREAVRSWVRRLKGADHRFPTSWVAETERVCTAADLAAPGAGSLVAETKNLVGVTRGSVPVRSGVRGPRGELDVIRRRGVAVVDPLHVPARALASPVDAIFAPDGRVTVTCPTFRPWAASDPIGARIAVRVVSIGDGRIVATGPLQLSDDGRRLTATLGPIASDDVAVEIHDLMAVGPSRCRVDQLPQIERLVALQEAYSLHRRAGVLRASGLAADADTDEVLSRVRLDDAAPNRLPDHLFGLESDSGRPLLAEFAGVLG